MTEDAADSVPLAEAAQRLGIREELVRQRIYRGKLQGRKVDGRWFVVVPDDKTGSDNGQTEPSGLSHQEQDATRPEEDSIDAVRTLIESQQQQIGFLQGELTARTEELRRKDIIIADLTHRLPQLPTITQDEEPTERMPQRTNGAPSRPWWKFWEVD
jgi:hypothetical protein